MATTFDIRLPHYPRGFHLITHDVLSLIPELPENGLLVVFIKHTSAGITINENADPDVRHDFNTFFNKLIPDGVPYFIHTEEGPDDMSAHIKASLIGTSVTPFPSETTGSTSEPGRAFTCVSSVTEETDAN